MLNRSRILGSLVAIVLATPWVAAQAVPAPARALGFEPGQDRKLADWSQIVNYFEMLDSASERVSVSKIGLSTLGRPFIVAIISSEGNLRSLPRIREAKRKLSDPRLISNPEERRSLILETPAVVAITCSIHSTEIVASQMSMELAHWLASDNSDSVRQILDNVVLLLIPSVNPDGVDIVVDWYRKTLGTKFEGTNPPVLYHHYAGHDNNRDWFMLTQVETKLLSRLFWREWYPDIVYDVHQMGSYGARMFVPPFFDPPNPNIDPVILRWVGALGMKMALALTSAGHKGIVTNSTYDTWWHGGLRTAPYYHNSIGILSEAASARIATPIEIKREELRGQTRGLANPLSTATNFPEAWEGGTWRPRDILEMELTAARALLREAALHRQELLSDLLRAAERALEAGKTQPPYAYIVPAEQHDPPTAARMINLLIEQGVEVHRAKSDFTADGRRFSAGSYVILLAQPYRANVKCLFELQRYPDRRIYPGGPAEPPYDVAGWTLPLQMGVDYVEIAQKFEAALEKIESAAATAPVAPAASNRSVFYLPPNSNNAFALVAEALRSADSISVMRLKRTVNLNGKDLPAGTFVLQQKSKARPNSTFDIQAQMARYGLSYEVGKAVDSSAAAALKGPRLAIYRSWIPSMDEGWTRWVLDQFKFNYATITDADLRAGGLREKFDVIILPDQGAQQITSGHRPGSYPPEYTGGIGQEGVTNLRSFVEAGGVLICLNSSSELALKWGDLAVKNALEGLRRDQFYAPGSILRARFDTSHPIAYGMRPEADVYFVSGTRSQRPGQDEELGTLVIAFAFEITDPARARAVARYVDENPLRSGWLLGHQHISGKAALVDASLGKGRVILFGFRPQHRAQTWGTFKLLFNSILMGAAQEAQWPSSPAR